MNDYQKIGFLTAGSGGNPTGIGDYVRRLDAAGKPAVVFCNDGTVGLSDIFAQWDRGSTVDHVAVYRSVSPWSGFPQNPDYSLAPKFAAENYREIYQPTIPREIADRRDRVWVLIGNEPDKTRAEWLAEFAFYSAELWMADGFKTAYFNWASGEPEPEHWRGSMMKTFLRFASVNPERVAVGLHEYSYSTDPVQTPDGERGPIWTDFPNRVGRFMDMFDACTEMGIFDPSVLIGEWGWRDVAIPEHDVALVDLTEIADLYAGQPAILGAGIWYLGEWQGSGIENHVQRLIAPVAAFSESYVAPTIPPVDPPDPDPEPDETLEKWVWRRSIEEQTVSLNPDAGLQKTMMADGLRPVESEFWDRFPGDGKRYAIQAGETDDGSIPRRAYVAPVPEPGQPWPIPQWINDPNQIVNDDPLAGFVIRAPFRVPFALTSEFDDDRNYANGKHEGADFDIFTAAADSTEPVLAGVDGVIVNPTNLSGYGQHVVLLTEYNGFQIKLIYAHMDRLYVQPGDRVQIGDRLGELGKSGLSQFEHVHLTMSVPGLGLSDYVYPDVVDPAPFVDMTPQNTKTRVNMTDFFRVPTEPEHWSSILDEYIGDIVILKNNWGANDERQQIQGMGTVWFVTKNDHWERRDFENDGIYLVADTSPGEGQMYKVTGDPWLPLEMTFGQKHVRNEHVEWFQLNDNCRPLPEKTTDWTNEILFANYYPQFMTGHFADGSTAFGIPFFDVVELHWFVNGQIEERYFYAAHIGLIQWEKRDGKRSWAVEHVNRWDQQPNRREQGCE